MAVDLERLIQDFRSAVGWPYVDGGASQGSVDCSGLFVWAFKKQGAKIKHGSNYIWRNNLSEKGSILGSANNNYRYGNGKTAAMLEPGMAVFKWNPNTPAKYHDGLGDYQHIGLVVSVKPLQIIHASTDGYIVKVDTKIGKWCAWGYLKDVCYSVDKYDENPSKTSYSYIKYGCKGAAVKALQSLLNTVGFNLQTDGEFGVKTRQAVKDYQQSRGLEVDGIVGIKTWQSILQES